MDTRLKLLVAVELSTLLREEDDDDDSDEEDEDEETGELENREEDDNGVAVFRLLVDEDNLNRFKLDGSREPGDTDITGGGGCGSGGSSNEC